jgi:mannose-6-phosphate isomerase
LSIQVHPNDALAERKFFGKTEMWYIMQADQDARIIVDLKKTQTQMRYLENLKAKLYFLS